jgi:hypothetical protein
VNQLVPLDSHEPPALITAAGDSAQQRFFEFFTANIRNRNTRRAYAQAVSEFLAWCEGRRVPSITAVQPVHTALARGRRGHKGLMSSPAQIRSRNLS